MKQNQRLCEKLMVFAGVAFFLGASQALGDTPSIGSAVAPLKTVTQAPPPMPVPTPTPAAAVSIVPVQVIYVSENQPVQIVDSQGRLIEVLYLKKKP